MWIITAINLPITTAFAASHNFCMSCSHFHLSQGTFCLYFCFDPLAIKVSVVQFPCIYAFSSFTPIVNFQFHTIVVREDTWHDFNHLEFAKISFAA